MYKRQGLEKLDQWLLKYGNDDSILSASELDGYFAAIVSGPRQVAPAVWYSAIWADQPPQWPSDKDGERFMKLAVELMSEATYMLSEEPDDYEAVSYTHLACHAQLLRQPAEQSFRRQR